MSKDNSTKITVDFSQKLGKIKPMNAVNNGPVYKQKKVQNITNLPEFTAARIPYARTHDASFCPEYGGEHTVDVNNIFRNFDADENDPASYDFTLTDEYMRTIELSGCKAFFRLGSKIEHEIKKYNTLPPKDFGKWARVCEHIIRHLCYGWAQGHNFDIKYWEIWNEPDIADDDTDPYYKLCWGGTREQFYEFFAVAQKHLKTQFPELKIGGPALCSPNRKWTTPFLQYLKERDIPLDFFSWHRYTTDPESFIKMAREARSILDDNGFSSTESICNEWNYVIGFNAEPFVQSCQEIIALKGAAFEASVMCKCQNEPLDLLMYYDARPCIMNGLFDYYTCKPIKGYYPITMWSDLAELGTQVKSEATDGLDCVSASDENRTATVIAYYTNEDNSTSKWVDVEFANKPSGDYTVYLLDESHNMEPLFSSNGNSVGFEMTPNAVVIIK